jgi:hypothetical protein
VVSLNTRVSTTARKRPLAQQPSWNDLTGQPCRGPDGHASKQVA